MKKIVVAGSICLDVEPILNPLDDFKLEQGKLTYLKDFQMHLGGVIGNTGLALKKLGIPVWIKGLLGTDYQALLIKTILKENNIDFNFEIIEDGKTGTSVIIAIPGQDRIMMNSRGTNQLFCAEYLKPSCFPKDTCLMHLAYPSNMGKFNTNNGKGLQDALKTLHEKDIATSIDTCFPDKENLKLNWTSIFQNWLPNIDFFLPSIEETLLTLNPIEYKEINSVSQGKNFINFIKFEEIRKMGTKLLRMGATVILLKLGKKGLYLRTASKERIQQIPNFFETPELINCWANREILFPPCFVDEIISTKGAGDTAIAGFLAAIALDKNPIDSLAFSSIAASYCIQSVDTTSKIPNFQEIEKIISTGFKQEEITPPENTWEKVSNYYLGNMDVFYK